MANAFKNTSLVTKMAIAAFENALVLGNRIDRQLDKDKVFAKKVGSTVNVRRPVRFTSGSGATVTSEDIEEAIVPVVLTTHKHVAFEIPDVDMELRVEDINERYIKPAANRLAQDVESDIAGNYIYVPNFVGTPGTTPSSMLDILNANSKLSVLGVPHEDRYAFFDPIAYNTLANGLKAVFPQSIATQAIENAKLGRYAGFDVFECQSIKSHTVGAYGGTPLVNGADQNTTYLLSKDTQTQSLITDGWTNSTTGILKAGDVITIAGVNAVNRMTLEDTGELAQFVVTADANSGASTGPATLTISPPIIISGPYKTCTAAPADNAAITVVTGTASTAYKQALAFQKNAITLATARLEGAGSGEGAVSSVMEHKGLSITATRWFDGTNFKHMFRLDILYGVKVQNPDFACRITS